VDGGVVAGTGEWAGRRFFLLDSDALLAPLLGA
jgi:hypothetical protein